jgi:cytochrome P450
VSNDDPFLALASECVELLSNKIASTGSIWIVDVIPALKHLPDWFPGASFKRKAKEWKAKMEEFTDKPYEWMKNELANGTARPSFCSSILEEDGKLNEQDEFDLKWTANSMYSASLDTSITAISHFFLAMLQHPEVAAQARAELDAVVGTSRLPNLNDRPNLPYLECIMSEVLRWGARASFVIDLPHRLMEDDMYNGMFLPKGSLVFGNIWAMLRSPTSYPQPTSFIPSRFSSSPPAGFPTSPPDPRTYVFGFGRRRCPGMFLIDSSLWLLMAGLLATCDLAAPEGGLSDVKFENAVFRLPSEFGVQIRPRSEHAAALINEGGA